MALDFGEQPISLQGVPRGVEHLVHQNDVLAELSRRQMPDRLGTAQPARQRYEHLPGHAVPTHGLHVLALASMSVCIRARTWSMRRIRSGQ